jgi:hypothetical protein
VLASRSHAVLSSLTSHEDRFESIAERSVRRNSDYNPASLDTIGQGARIPLGNAERLLYAANSCV